MEQQTPNFPAPLPPNPPATPTGKPARPKLSNVESVLLILFALFVLILYSNGTSSNTLNEIQRFLMYIWFLGGLALFYKNFNLFGGEFPQDESSKLTTTHKVLIWIFSIINPSIVGGTVILIWYKKNPAKARRANLIAIIVFLIEVLLGFFIGYLQSKGT